MLEWHELPLASRWVCSPMFYFFFGSHRMYAVRRCGLLLHILHGAWSLCLYFSVCVFACVLDTRVSRAKMAEPIGLQVNDKIWLRYVTCMAHCTGTVQYTPRMRCPLFRFYRKSACRKSSTAHACATTTGACTMRDRAMYRCLSATGIVTIALTAWNMSLVSRQCIVPLWISTGFVTTRCSFAR